MEGLSPILQFWGYELISFFLNEIAQKGIDSVVDRIERLYKEILAQVRSVLLKRWSDLQVHCDMPLDWDSLAESVACEMLYFQIFRTTVGCDLSTQGNDLFPHLIDAAYRQLLRMDNRLPDEEGLCLFETALLKFLESIASGKLVNGERWRIDRNVSRSGPQRPPTITTEAGYTFPDEQWGWIEEPDEEHPIYPRQKIVAYADNTEAGGSSFLYLTDAAREDLLKIIKSLPGGESITSEKALGDLAEHDGWIGKRADSKRRTVQIVPPQGPRRVWVIRLDKWLAHYEDIPSEQEETPANVTAFPSSPALLPGTPEEEVF